MPPRGRQDPGEPFRRISVEEAQEMLDEGNAVAVDVRAPDEWKAGHVQGALFIPVDDVLERIDELPKDRDLLFICERGVRSGLACEMAVAMGLPSERVYNIEEGTPVWIQRNLPTEYGE